MAVVDIRNNPQSMKYGFSKKSFSGYVESAGIRYFHLPELGIPSSMRKGLGKCISYIALFQDYETVLLPQNEKAQSQLLDLIANFPRIALVCFEADSHFCHRHVLMDYMLKKRAIETPVLHL
jgi:uncharacterized protein (DUF488 family)